MNGGIHGNRCLICSMLLFFIAILSGDAQSQDKIKIAYSSTDTLNQIWTIAQDAGFYKKNGLDVDLVYIGSTTVGVAAIIAQDIQVGNAAGSGVANANVRGADTVSVACTINVLAYELVVLDSVKTAEDLKGKSIGISRFGSVSDVAARELLKGLGLRPMEDVKILQVGGASERAAGFSRGVIAGFPSPPGNVHLIPGGLPHRILANMADLKKPYPLPFICAVTTKSYLAKNRSVVKRVVMALIEASHFFKTNKDATQKIVAKYLRGANKAYLDSSYESTAKTLERVPYTTREGMKIQLDEALKQTPGSTVTVDSLIDDSIVREIEKEGFIDRVYGRK
ncbi:MAG TPA: ABC transporter substrate-binding protein [Candidatus Binatia bacterium]|jgi:NitT/TauT family transport system substrate-binding protein|nr:ABC transporter substrate-binding protein [Candidatus Binatia bacterium]